MRDAKACQLGSSVLPLASHVLTWVALTAYRTMMGRDDDMAWERYFTLAYGSAGLAALATTCLMLYAESPSTTSSLKSSSRLNE